MSNLSSNSRDEEAIILSSGTRETSRFSLSASDSEVYDATRKCPFQPSRRSAGDHRLSHGREANMERTPFLPRGREGQDHPGSQTRAASQEGDGPRETVPPGGEGPTQIRQDEPRLPRDEPRQIAGGGRNVEGEGGQNAGQGGGAQIAGQGGDRDRESGERQNVGERGGQSAGQRETLQIDGRDERRQIPGIAEPQRSLWSVCVFLNTMLVLYFGIHWPVYDSDDEGYENILHLITSVLFCIFTSGFLSLCFMAVMDMLRTRIHQSNRLHALKRWNLLVKVIIDMLANLGLSAYLEMIDKDHRRYDAIYFLLGLYGLITSLVGGLYLEGYSEFAVMMSAFFNGVTVYFISMRWWFAVVGPFAVICLGTIFTASRIE